VLDSSATITCDLFQVHVLVLCGAMRMRCWT